MSPFHEAGHSSIDEQAANWFSRNRNGRDPSSREQFNIWFANPAHARAYSEFESLWADLGELEQINRPVALPCADGASTLYWPPLPPCCAPYLR